MRQALNVQYGTGACASDSVAGAIDGMKCDHTVELPGRLPERIDGQPTARSQMTAHENAW